MRRGSAGGERLAGMVHVKSEFHPDLGSNYEEDAEECLEAKLLLFREEELLDDDSDEDEVDRDFKSAFRRHAR